jgi:hypothetical protein
MMLALFSLVALTTAKTVAEFGKADDTVWQTLNDPVMGGVSHSSFYEGETSGIWKGKVEIVPFLKKPGFCTLRSAGHGKETDELLDLSNSDGIIVRAAAAKGSGLKDFRVTLSTEGAGRGMMSHVMYSADFTVTEDIADHFVSWKEFSCSYHGKNMDWFCPKIYHELEKVNQLGIMTHYPLDEPTEFELELASITTRDSTGPKKKCPFAEFKRKIISFATPFFYDFGRQVVQPLFV